MVLLLWQNRAGHRHCLFLAGEPRSFVSPATVYADANRIWPVCGVAIYNSPRVLHYNNSYILELYSAWLPADNVRNRTAILPTLWMTLVFVLHVHMVGLNSRSRLPILEWLYSADMLRKVLVLVFCGEACFALREISMVSNMRVNSSSNEPSYTSSVYGHRCWIGKSCFLPCSCQTVCPCGFSGLYFLVCPVSSVHRFRWNIIGNWQDLVISHCPC